MATLAKGSEHREGVRAFLEKRPADCHGGRG